MKKIIAILLSVIVLTAQANVQAQDTDEIRRRAAEMVGQLGDYLNYMADKDNSLKNRQYYRKKALNLFIGKGEPYTIGGKQRSAVSMQTTSLRNKTPKSTPMGEYFNHLINLRYADVELKTTEIANIKVSDLKKISADTYECTCYISQVFIGYGTDGRPAYRDITRKSVQCYITVEDTVNGDEQYIVQLGNVTATHTERF